jgi:PAS domain S-box-containing protein
MRKLGKDPEKLIGAVLWEEFSEVPNAATLRRVMSERIVATEELFYAALGEWVENHVYPAADGGLLLFQRYITERKRMEMELQRSEANLAEAQRLCHVGSRVWNVKTGSVWWSRETYRVYGFEPGRVTPTVERFYSIVHPEDRSRVEREFEQVAREKRDYEIDFRIVRPDGAIRYMHSVGHWLFDVSGTLTEVMGTVMDVTDRRHAEGERARLLRNLITAQEEERRRISHEMHDQLGQQLSVLMLKIGALKAACHDDVELGPQIESLEGVARQLDADVDFLVRNIRPTALDDLGLPIALSNFVASWKTHFGVNAELHISGLEFERLHSEVETLLYRVLQEALTNIAKHAAAANVDILLERHSDHVSLIVEDDGAGFDVHHLEGPQQGGLGVVGMRERAALVGGSLDIESQPGKGTTVVVRIPSIPSVGA